MEQLASLMVQWQWSLNHHKCAVSLRSNAIFKFADDTIVVGQIIGKNASEYRREIDCLVEWHQSNNIALYISKTKQLMTNKHN